MPTHAYCLFLFYWRIGNAVATDPKKANSLHVSVVFFSENGLYALRTPTSGLSLLFAGARARQRAKLARNSEENILVDQTFFPKNRHITRTHYRLIRYR